MANVYALDGVIPVVASDAFVHPSAVLIGDVIIGRRCYIGPTACLRGDFGRVEIKDGANVQDGCVLHGYPETDTVVEEGGHIGHGAILHACRIGRNALIGMNAVVMDGAVVGEHSIVAAMSLVKEGANVAARTLVAGMPARVVRALTDEELAWKTDGTSLYEDLAQLCRRSLVATTPLASVERDRPRIDVGRAIPLHLIKAMRARGTQP
ncbi:phenylacetic acid degradation protein PaaY [Pandoraea captiosa]|uniref:Phenylacetic acid degradation protein PaaY n=1 Tax=Pandoraea captiosa TaxID=2508302 RepID=A0A5E5ABY6_9BURK|nr:DapH/DapD/GlmU-related protein [Pandoraea captiosa]VVE70023.1 phenylacetic acid degradation protein PaaY [Pandoraea captiosa]